MSEFGVSATLEATVDSSSLRAARAEVEDELADSVEVPVEAVADTSSLSQRTARPDGGVASGAMSLGSTNDLLDGLDDLATERNDLLEEIHDELEVSTRQGAQRGGQQGGMSRLQTILLGRAALGGGFPGGGAGAGAKSLLARGLAGTSVFGLATTQNTYGEGEEPPGIFGEGKSIMDVLGRDEPIVDLPEKLGNASEKLNNVDLGDRLLEAANELDGVNIDLPTSDPSSIIDLDPVSRREFAGVEGHTSSILDLDSESRRMFAGAPGPDDTTSGPGAMTERIREYAYNKRSDRPPSTPSSRRGSKRENGAANKSTTRNGNVRVNQNFEVNGVSRRELERALEEAKREAVNKALNELTESVRGL